MPQTLQVPTSTPTQSQTPHHHSGPQHALSTSTFPGQGTSSLSRPHQHKPLYGPRRLAQHRAVYCLNFGTPQSLPKVRPKQFRFCRRFHALLATALELRVKRHPPKNRSTPNHDASNTRSLRSHSPLPSLFNSPIFPEDGSTRHHSFPHPVPTRLDTDHSHHCTPHFPPQRHRGTVAPLGKPATTWQAELTPTQFFKECGRCPTNHGRLRHSTQPRAKTCLKSGFWNTQAFRKQPRAQRS